MTRLKNITGTRNAFYQSLKAGNMAPLWEVLRGLVTPEPNDALQPAIWRYRDIRPYLMQAASLITAEEAERRVLILENPAAAGQSRITNTLYAGLQLLLPGEIARSHRHTQSALRFIVEGEGAFTALDGRKVTMRQWDLILTPNWVWHDHGNASSAPMMWLDGLDIPLIAALNTSFVEHMAGAHPPANDDTNAAPTQTSRGRYRATTNETASPFHIGPTYAYPYAEWRQALEDEARHAAVDESDGFRLEFIDPVGKGAVMRTISAFCQLIPGGMTTHPTRSTDGMVFVVVEGAGSAEVGKMRLTLEAGDIFVVPNWTPRAFHADKDLVLFSYSDKATQEKLGLWRRQ